MATVAAAVAFKWARKIVNTNETQTILNVEHDSAAEHFRDFARILLIAKIVHFQTVFFYYWHEKKTTATMSVTESNGEKCQPKK